MIETLLDGTFCKICLDNGITKGFMSKQYYLRNKHMYRLAWFSSIVKVFQVRNGVGVNILFIIKAIQGHMFEICTIVSDIHDNVDLFKVSETLLN